MGQIWNWDPVFNALNQLSGQSRYNSALNGLFGSSAPTQNTTQTANVSMPGITPGMPAAQPQGVPHQVQAGISPFQMPVQINTPDMSTSQPGPLSSMASMQPFFQALGPQGFPLLAQTMTSQLERQQRIADNKVTPISDQEAQGLGLRPGGVYGRDISGNIQVIQPSDMKSPGAIQQINDQAHITPITDPNDPRLPPPNARPPGTIYGVDAAGNVAPIIKGDAKSKIAEDQAQAERAAAMKEQMAMYGLGTNGGAGFDATKPLTGPYETVAQSIANYQMDENAALSRYPAPVRASIQARVQGINPDYRQQDFSASKSAQTKFAAGQQGNTVRSLNVAIQHLNTLGQLSDALNNNNIPAVNALGNTIAAQLGKPAPTNFNAAKAIVGDEVVKAIIGTGGALADRENAQNQISAASSPAQLKGVINTYQKLMAGQLNGLRKQYEVSTKAKNFEQYLSPETISVLGNGTDNASNAPAANIIRYDAKGNRIP